MFDAGEKLFIALVEEGGSAARDGSIGDSSETETKEDERGDEGGKQAIRLKRKVVVRDEYVHSGEDDDIFLVDRESRQQYVPATLGCCFLR